MEPKNWPVIDEIDGPANEPEFLVALINTALEVGAVEAIKRMQKRLLMFEEKKLRPSVFEAFKHMPIYTQEPKP